MKAMTEPTPRGIDSHEAHSCPVHLRDAAFVPVTLPVYKGRLRQRYKRFFADIDLEKTQDCADAGKTITAHCPNTGSMKTCGSPGDIVWVSHNPDPKRKLHYTWEFTGTTGGLIGVNTARPNAVVEAALKAGIIPELKNFSILQREVKYGTNSRIDILASSAGGKHKCYIEVKNTTLLHDGGISFPDAVTERGLKHLKELVEVVKAGHEAVAFFLVNRPDGDFFAPADHIDPKWSEGLKHAVAKGVTVLAYRSQNFVDGSRIGERLKVKGI